MKMITLVILSSIALSCSSIGPRASFNSVKERRDIASIDEVISQIERSSNPYEVLGTGPSSTISQFDRHTSKRIERITGWDWWTLSKMLDEGTLQQEFTTLTETQANSVKKVFDSRTLISKLHERKGLRLKLGPWEWRLGAKDVRKLNTIELRDIQIYLENELGSFQVKWTKVEAKQMKIGNQVIHSAPSEGYLTKFQPKAKNPDFQQEFERLRRKLNQNKEQLKLKYPDGIPLKEQLALLKDGEKILGLSAVEFGDSRVLKLSYELSRELDTRLKTPGTPLTKTIIKELSQFISNSCSNAFVPRKNL